MEEVIKLQLKRTKMLMEALEITKVSDNPEVANHCKSIQSSLIKAESLLEVHRNIFNKKKQLCDKMEELTKKCNEIAGRATAINEGIFPEQTYLSPSFQNTEQPVNSEQFNSFEVSPCPSEWANGALDTPVPSGTRNLGQPVVSEQIELPYIKPLQPSELESVPTYMKGRLTCEDVNFLIGTMNSVLKKKYSIVKLKKKAVIKRKDLSLYCNWKAQEVEYKMIGQIFFTIEDMADLAYFKMDKASHKMTQILRHTRRIRQSQVPGKKVLFIVI